MSVLWVCYHFPVSKVWSTLRWLYMKLMASITTQEEPNIVIYIILIEQSRSVYSRIALWTALCITSLNSKKSQSVEVGTQEIMAEWLWGYDEQDRCVLGLSNSWQCWWQDRRTGRVVCFVPILQQPPPLPAPDRGDAGSRVFVIGCWQKRYSARADGKCVILQLWAYVCMLCVGTHLTCVYRMTGRTFCLHGLSA